MTPREPIRVLLDTNFLMLPIRFSVDIQSELGRIVESSFEMVTTPAVVNELLRLKNQVKPSEVKEIDFALVNAEGIKKLDDTLKSEEDVDDQLLRLAKSRRIVVATTDAGLRRRIRSAGFPVIYMRQRRYIAIDGII